MKVHLNITVFGKVQGVFFRASTKKKAEELGVKGLVKNQKDGTVYIEAEAEEAIVNEFLRWCSRGSLASNVRKVDSVSSAIKNYSEFSIYH